MLKLFIGDFPEGENPRPKSMLSAVTMLYFLLLFKLCWGAWQLIILYNHLHAPSALLPFATMLATSILTIVLPCIITYGLTENIKQGKHWARITYTVLALGYCGLLLYASYTKVLQGVFMPDVIFFLHLYLSASPILYLFRKDSNEWFKQAAQA